MLSRSNITGTELVSHTLVNNPRDQGGQLAHHFAGIDDVPAGAEGSAVHRRGKIVALLSMLGARCPKCGGVLARSRTRPVEQVLKFLSDRRPHRCRRCNWRGWRHPVPDDDDAIKLAEQLLADLFAMSEATKSPS